MFVVSQTILLDPAELYIGISGGTTINTVQFSPRVNQNTPLIGKNGGIAIRYITENHFGLQAELNYAEHGWFEDEINYWRKFNYIEFPFLSHFFVGDRNRFILNIGPKLSYLFCEESAEITTFPEKEQQITPTHFNLDYGITAGLGYNLKTKKAGVFQLELRAYYGLSDIFDNDKTQYFSKSQHLNGSINIGWFFQLTGRN